MTTLQASTTFWITLKVKMWAQVEGSKHNYCLERNFAMSSEDFARLSFGDILDTDLHKAVEIAPTWDVPGQE